MKMVTLSTFQPSISSDLLKTFIGKRVSKLVRYSWWPKENVASECDILDEMAFSLTAGPLAVIFEDGDVLGVSSDPSLNSVVVWLEHGEDKKNQKISTLDEDTELFPINFDDSNYANSFWVQFNGLSLLKFSILKKLSMSAIEKELPSEVGLCFLFENNQRFIAAHGLHDGSDDFSVLQNKQLELNIAEQLEEIPL
jgi:hypothetical protein